MPNKKVGLSIDYVAVCVVSVRCDPLTVDSGDFSLLCFQPEAVHHSFTPSWTVLQCNPALATDNFNRTAQYDAAAHRRHTRRASAQQFVPTRATAYRDIHRLRCTDW